MQAIQQGQRLIEELGTDLEGGYQSVRVPQSLCDTTELLRLPILQGCAACMRCLRS
jgi:hypothetical protein